jgi:hypothetical protein
LEEYLEGITDTEDECYEALKALELINDYFDGKGKQDGPRLNADRTKDAELRAAADLISRCLNSDHLCNAAD